MSSIQIRFTGLLLPNRNSMSYSPLHGECTMLVRALSFSHWCLILCGYNMLGNESLFRISFSPLYLILYQNTQHAGQDTLILPTVSHLFEVKMANTYTSNREEKHTHYYSSNPYTVCKVQRKVSYTLVRTKAIENKWHVLTRHCLINTSKDHTHRHKE